METFDATNGILTQHEELKLDFCHLQLHANITRLPLYAS